MWHKFPKTKPKKNGWYQCTVEVSNQQRYVMDLFWYGDRQQFRDNRRQDVFDSYDVYGYNNETKLNDKKLYTINLCNRTDEVVAWRQQYKPYMNGFMKEE
jgi:hypothetical protein